MLVSETDLVGWFERLGLPMAVPLVGQNLVTALTFFRRRLPNLDEETLEGFLRGIDLHKSVRPTWLRAGEIVGAVRRTGEPLSRLFYRNIGGTAGSMGVGPEVRFYQRFEVRQPSEVLAASTGDYIYPSADDAFLGHMPLRWPGGGTQYVIPDAAYVLVALTRPEELTGD